MRPWASWMARQWDAQWVKTRAKVWVEQWELPWEQARSHQPPPHTLRSTLQARQAGLQDCFFLSYHLPVQSDALVQSTQGRGSQSARNNEWHREVAQLLPSSAPLTLKKKLRCERGTLLEGLIVPTPLVPFKLEGHTVSRSPARTGSDFFDNITVRKPLDT